MTETERPHRKFTEEECLAIGGHHWNFHSANDVVDKFGNQTGLNYLLYYLDGEPQYRTCRHCGLREIRKQDRWEIVK
jgi:hypothetical protein